MIHQSATGMNTMHFFFASSTDVPHGVPLGEAWFTWLSEGVAPPESEGLSQGTIIFIGVAGMLQACGMQRNDSNILTRPMCQPRSQCRRPDSAIYAGPCVHAVLQQGQAPRLLPRQVWQLDTYTSTFNLSHI